MNRDFGLHFAAWFLVSTLIVLSVGFRIKALEATPDPDLSGAKVFCYSFVCILVLAFIGAIIDVLIVGSIVDGIKRRRTRSSI